MSTATARESAVINRGDLRNLGMGWRYAAALSDPRAVAAYAILMEAALSQQATAIDDGCLVYTTPYASTAEFEAAVDHLVAEHVQANGTLRPFRAMGVPQRRANAAACLIRKRVVFGDRVMALLGS